jgi:hypothetical protein
MPTWRQKKKSTLRSELPVSVAEFPIVRRRYLYSWLSKLERIALSAYESTGYRLLF